MANRAIYGPPANSLTPQQRGLFPALQRNQGAIGDMLLGGGIGLLSQGPSLTPQGPFAGLGQGLMMGRQMTQDRRRNELQDERLAMARQQFEAQQAAVETRRAAIDAAGGGAMGQAFPDRFAEAQFRAPPDQWSAPEPMDINGRPIMVQTGPGGKVRQVGGGGVNVYNAPQGYEVLPDGSLRARTGGPADPNRIQPGEARANRDRSEALGTARSALNNYRDILLGKPDASGKRAGGTGTEFTGEKVRALQSARTNLVLQAKTLADLGALSGPDIGLVNDLVGADPTSLMANVGGVLTGGANMANYAASLDQVEKMLNDAEAALAQRTGSPTATPLPAAPGPTRRKFNPATGAVE